MNEIEVDIEEVCRYCYSNEDQEDLINPCGCSSLVHKKCLRKWHYERGMERCEICQEKLNVKYKYKFTKVGNISHDTIAAFSILFCIFFILLIFSISAYSSDLGTYKYYLFILICVMVLSFVSSMFCYFMDIFRFKKVIK